MDVDLRAVKKLRESAAARAALGPILEAVCGGPGDLSRLRVVCDWIQYRQNFREAVIARPIADTDVEIAFDLRRCAGIAIFGSSSRASSSARSGAFSPMSRCRSRSTG